MTLMLREAVFRLRGPRVEVPERLALGDEFYVFGFVRIVAAETDYAGLAGFDWADLTLEPSADFRLVPVEAAAP